MGFFDIKLILILFLIITIYYIYTELNSVKKNISEINLHINNTTKFINSNIDTIYKKVNKKQHKNNKNIFKEAEILEDSPKQSAESDIQSEIRSVDTHPLHFGQIGKKITTEDKMELFNLQNNPMMNSMMNPMINSFMNEMMNPIMIVHASSAQDFDNDLMNIIESEIQNISHVIQNMMDPEVNGMTRMDIPLKLNENEVKVEILDSEESKSKTSSHVEVYSNDSDNQAKDNNNQAKDNNNQAKDSNNQIKFNTNKKEKDYELILNNLGKLKLPELQDVAIEFKLPIQINQKKKTRNELMSNIKDYIVNLKNETS